MKRPLIFAALALTGLLSRPAFAQTEVTEPAASASPAAATDAAGLPARPKPFKFVNDQAGLLAPADAKKLENGLRKYADQNGTQVVVVTVPSLGGRTAADYGRALGNAWGVGQRGKNNGMVVLIAKQERKVAIEAGNGVSDRITADVKQRVIAQDFGPQFKQNNYFAGLRKGLSTLMQVANPGTTPTPASAATAGAAGAGALSGGSSNLNGTGASPATALSTPAETTPAITPPAEPASSGPGIGTLLLGALGLGAVFLLVRRLFGGNKSAAQANAPGGPNFYPNQPVSPTPNFGAPQGPGYNQGYGPGPQQQGGGMMGGMGGILATGAAAAAGAYLGNKIAGSGHDAASAPTNFDNAGLGGNAAGLGAAGLGGAGLAGAAGTGAAGDYFAGQSGAADNAPDYFSDANTADSGGDFFTDNSSYDDMSGGDTGGGGFDGGGDDSGSF